MIAITLQEYAIAGIVAAGLGVYFLVKPKSAPKATALAPETKVVPTLNLAPVQTSAPHEVAHGAVNAAAAAVQVAASVTTTHPDHVQKAAVALTAAATKVLGNVDAAADATSSKLPAKKPTAEDAAKQAALSDANDALKKAADALQRARG